MKKYFGILCISVICISFLALSSCTPGITSFDPLDPPDFKPTAAPTDWVTPGQTIAHVKVGAINPGSIPVTTIEIPGSKPAYYLKALSDGGALSISIVTDENTSTGKTSLSRLRAARFRNNGSVAWDKTIINDAFQGYPATMCLMPDDGFALTLRTVDPESKDGNSVDCLYLFAPDGTLKLKTPAGSIPAGAFDSLFAPDKDTVYAVGTVPMTDSSGTFTGNYVAVSRLGKNESLLHRVSSETAKNVTLISAGYSSGTGLVLLLREDLITGTDMNVKYQLLCLDENFQKKWSSDFASGSIIFELTVLPENNGFLLNGTVPPAGKIGDTGNLATLFYYDGSGAPKWVYTADKSGIWLRAATRISAGRIAAGYFYISEDKHEYSKIVLLSSAGTIMNTLDKLVGSIEEIIPTKDGGFTVLFRQSVRGLPQPPYISSLWTDTEALIAHYDKDFKLEWRRTVDRYKHSTRSDQFVFTTNDRILVG